MKHSSQPLISCLIVTPAGGRRIEFLKRSIGSYLSQTYANKELLIILDNPEKKDHELLESYLSSLGRSDIRCIRPDGKASLGALRNISLKRATGDILCQWDDDDLSHPDRLAAQAEFLLTNQLDATILTDNLHIFYHQKLCYWETGKHNLTGGRPCTLMMRNGLGLEYPESGSLSKRGEDWHILDQLKSKCKVGYFEAPAFHYLYFFHGSNTMDSSHHRMMTVRTSASRDILIQNQERLINGIKEIPGFDLPTLRIMEKNGPLYLWSRSSDSILPVPFAPAYRSRKLKIFPGKEPGTSLVHSPVKSLLTEMPGPVAQALSRMTDFKRLDEHVWGLCTIQNPPLSDPYKLMDFIREVAGKGFLVSEEELKNTIIRHDEKESVQKVPVTSLGVPTFNRPDVLRRCLVSFLENFRAYGRTPRILVGDDSHLPAPQAANMACLEELSRSYPEFEFAYAGLAEKRRYGETLARHSGVDPEIIEFALFNPENLLKKACGPNRNVLFLETVGECFLSVDDDVICRPSISPYLKQAISVTSKEDPTRVDLFGSLQTLLDERPGDNVDLIGLHEDILGKSLGAVLKSHPEIPISFGHLGADFLNRLEKRPARTRVSWNGLYGDSGATFPGYYLWKDEFTYDQVTTSEEAYRALSVSRQIFRAPECLTFGAGGYCQSTVLAYDHRSVLPPFMPLRGLDIVFGKILVNCFGDSLIGYHPWALLHVPAETRSNEAKDIAQAGSATPYYSILQALIGMYPRPEFDHDEATSLRNLGAHLLGIVNKGFRN